MSQEKSYLEIACALAFDREYPELRGSRGTIYNAYLAGWLRSREKLLEQQLEAERHKAV